MMDNTEPTSPPGKADASPAWQPLPPNQRRVIGVLVEKAKTTPSGYPMSLNAVVTGSNQKSNRAPAMNLTPEQVGDALDALRSRGAVAEVHTGGRVAKYRHYMYEWLGVDKTEIAVMTELLLRGAQTVGELRGRAARMEPIDGTAALRPVLDGLIAKGLVVELTPAGRGQIITHGLYPPDELERVRAKSGASTVGASHAASPVAAPVTAPVVPTPPRERSAATPPIAASTPGDEVAQLRDEVAQLRSEVAQVRKDLEDLWSNLR